MRVGSMKLQRIVMLLLAALITNSGHAWNIGSKESISGPVIHTTYFLTNNNASFPVHAQAYVGSFVDGVCHFTTAYDLGTETLQTGDYVDIDGFLLKSVIGGGYTCMTIFYISKQIVMETLQLIYNGLNYATSLPPT